jgi:short-subunit dehydrogenase
LLTTDSIAASIPRAIELTVNKTALVTGASGGLGHAIARGLAGRGVKLVLTARRVDALEALAAELGARTIVADLARADDLDRLVAEAGVIDILVANAGLPGAGAMGNQSLDDIDRTIAVNLRAPIVLSQAMMGGMVSRGSGQLVFISSLSGKFATPGSALYSATKIGLRGYAISLRQDLHETGVGVSTIFPGPIRDAGMWSDGGETPPPGVTTRSPQDVANAVVRAIEKDKGEIDVASPIARMGGAIAQVAPSVAAAINRRAGAKDMADRMATALADRR